MASTAKFSTRICTIHQNLSNDLTFCQQAGLLDPFDQDKLLIIGLQHQQISRYRLSQSSSLNGIHLVIYNTKDVKIEHIPGETEETTLSAARNVSIHSTSSHIHVIVSWVHENRNNGFGTTLEMRYYRFSTNNRYDCNYKQGIINISAKNTQYIPLTPSGHNHAAIVFKNWLFISGGNNTETSIHIYKLNTSTDNGIQPIQKIKTIMLPENTLYRGHGMIVKSYKEKVNELTREKVMQFELILFGSMCSTFCMSFCLVNIELRLNHNMNNINAKDIIKHSQSQTHNISDSIVDVNYSVYDFTTSVVNKMFTLETFDKLACIHRAFKTGLRKSKSRKKGCGTSNHDIIINPALKKYSADIVYKIFGRWAWWCFCSFSYHYLRNRYLILIGGKLIKDTMGFETNYLSGAAVVLRTIFCYDFMWQEWYISEYKLPKSICSHSSVLSKDEKKIYVIGKNEYNINVNWTLNIIEPILWHTARVIWIGFYKNDENNQCLIDRLPKDIVSMILLEYLCDEPLIDSMTPIVIPKPPMHKTKGQEYAQVIELLGNLKMKVLCSDGKTRQARVSGPKIYRMWFERGDFVLVSLKFFQDQKCDVVTKYSTEQVKLLRKKGHLPKIFQD